MRHGTLYALLTKAALHRRLSLSLRLALLAGAALPVWLLLLCAADNLFNLPPRLRSVLAFGSLAVVASGVAHLVWRFAVRPFDPARTAVYLEQRFGIADNRLINAVHFGAIPNCRARSSRPFCKQRSKAAAACRCAMSGSTRGCCRPSSCLPPACCCSSPTRSRSAPMRAMRSCVFSIRQPR